MSVGADFRARVMVDTRFEKSLRFRVDVKCLTGFRQYTKDILDGILSNDINLGGMKNNNKEVKFRYLPNKLAKLLDKDFRIIKVG